MPLHYEYWECEVCLKRYVLEKEARECEKRDNKSHKWVAKHSLTGYKPSPTIRFSEEE